MRWSSRTWFLISLALLAAAWFFWELGEKQFRQSAPADAVPARPARAPASSKTSSLAPSAASASSISRPDLELERELHPHRLRNTPRTLDELLRMDTAVLLHSAFIDTAAPAALDIPAHLRAAGEPGAYVVQGKGKNGASLRRTLLDTGLIIVSYIPNNSFLVRGDGAAVARAAASSVVGAVLPFEPYYKLDSDLLSLGVAQAALPRDTWLHISAYPDSAEQVRSLLLGLGLAIGVEEQLPFGVRFTVDPGSSDWLMLAQAAEVQGLEIARGRRVANDLSRVRLGISADTVVSNNYLGLTGSNVLVNINDSGVEEAHPDLKGRVKTTDTNGFTLVDLEGHGTHVAGIIASSGSKSTTVTNVPGSLTNGSFRGMAPAAELFVLPIDLRSGPLVSDRYLLETAASTNVLISNNSWYYPLAFGYNSSAAIFDSATRDALPQRTGDQPMLFVFAAANYGEAGDAGFGGRSGSIASPGNAKNVITVGALESPRQITNNVYVTNVVVVGDQNVTNVSTNYFFLKMTDSDDEVAGYSSRGNVGLGTEGPYGRFKPDVVGPGTFIVSTRASHWTLDTNLPYSDALESLNDGLGEHYRFESGTSMSAPAISGLLALMQEFFEQRVRVTNSPALMKALLINASRSVNSGYSLDTHTFINYQGWGLPDITRLLPVALTNLVVDEPSTETDPEEGDAGDTNAPPPSAGWDLARQQALPWRIVDQSPTNALATGQSLTWNLSLGEDTRNFPLRMTLVWTDPPGNPAAGVKLVNDLDLVVTNVDSGEVFYGNDFPQGADFTRPKPADTLDPSDLVNNVENVFLREPLGTNYSVTVRGRRVNVHASGSLTNDIAQDFALVIATDQLELTNAFTRFEPARPAPLELRSVAVLTNGVALLNQRAGANDPLVPQPGGQPNQWSFYVFTNTYDNAAVSAITNGTNVAFITFLPPNVSRPRFLEADIDMYVSTNAALTNLDAQVLATSFKAVDRGGSQVVFFTNAVPDTVYYIGVKAEDQQSGEFGLVGLSTNDPFDRTDENGNRVLRGLPVQVTIPDGSPERPGVAYMFAIGTSPMTVARVTAEAQIIHQSIGDLTGTLSHNDRSAVLINHFSDLSRGQGGTNFVFNYDDSDSGRSSSYAQPTDGPGSLTDFLGEEGSGVWMLTMVDSAMTHTGLVQDVNIRILPVDFSLEAGVSGSVLANRFAFYSVDVPADAIRMNIYVSQMTGPLDLYVRRGRVPTFEDYDLYAQLEPPTNSISLSTRDVPPLVSGRYIIGLYNPTSATVNFRIRVEIERNLRDDAREGYGSADTPLVIPDAAASTSTIFIPSSRPVINARVGIRLDHPRVSDLALRLISPAGTRLLLFENRGDAATTALGAGDSLDMHYTAFTDETNIVNETIKFAAPPFSAWPSGPVVLPADSTTFDGATLGLYGPGTEVGGWRVLTFDGSTNTPPPGSAFTSAEVVDSTNPAFLRVLSLGTCRITRDVVTAPGRTYTVSFLYRSGAEGPLLGRLNLNGALAGIFTAATNEWVTFTKSFVSARGVNVLDLGPVSARAGLLIDSLSVTESGGFTYYLPEERFKPWEGESALGNWRLEIEDAREGPFSALVPQLINWQLQLLLAPTNPPAITLTNRVTYEGVLTGDEVQYFIVNVPRRVQSATNYLIGDGDLRLLYSPSGLPTGTYPDDVVVDDAGAGGLEVLVLRTNSTPALLPGRRYYLGVANNDTNAVASFLLRVDFEPVSVDLLNLPRLTNDVAITNTIAEGEAMDYFEFFVTTNAFRTRFELSSTNGNVDLFVRRARPVPNPLPTPENHDYASRELGSLPDEVVIDVASVPVPLTPGRWFVGVLNADEFPVTYVLRVVEEPAPPFVILEDGVGKDGVAPANGAFGLYYLFPVVNSNAIVRVDLYNLEGPADVFIGKDRFPTPLLYDYLLSSLDGRPTRLFLESTNASEILGNWILGVSNLDTNEVAFTLRATVFDGTNAVARPLVSGVPLKEWVFGSPGFPEVEYFTVSVSDQAKALDVTVWPEDGDVDLYLKRGDMAGFASNEADFFSESPGLGRERVRLIRNLPPIHLEPGIWTIAVVNRELYPVGFRIQVNEYLDQAEFELLENVEALNLALPGDDEHYRLKVPEEALALFAVLTDFDGVDLGGLHMTMSHVTVDTNSPTPVVDGTLDGGAAEVITLRTNSSPAALAPGEWLITVTNTGSAAQAFRLFFFLEHPLVPGDAIIRPFLEVTNQSVCLSWDAELGQSYGLQGKQQWIQPSWEWLGDDLIAASSNLTACIPLTEPYRYFQVILGGRPPLVDTNIFLLPDVVLTNGNVCVTWGSTPGGVYGLEWQAELGAGVWSPVASNITASGIQTTHCVTNSGPTGFYRVTLVGGTVTPPSTNAPAEVPVGAQFEAASGSVCLTWTAMVGASYRVETKSSLAEVTWRLALPEMVANSESVRSCIPATNGLAFFRVMQVTGGTSPPPDPPPPARLVVQAIFNVASSELCLSWPSAVGQSFRLESRASLTAGAWAPIGGVVQATGTTMQQCVGASPTSQFFRVVEIRP